MNVITPQTQPDVSAQSLTGYVDCDVHPYFKNPAELDAFLPAQWREHRKEYGARSRSPLAYMPQYPRLSPQNGMRMDAFPPDGSLPGSDLPFMREQLIDLFGMAHGILLPLLGRGGDERNLEYGAAMCTAVNDWMLAYWCDPEPRLKASIQVNVEHAESAIAEIEKRAGDRRFAQVQINQRGLEPLGRHRYRKILQAAAANGFPIAMHLGGTSGHASTAGGWPSYYHEEHHAYVQSMEGIVTSLVVEGVFEQIPNLKVALVEGGFAWIPALTWRLDKHYRRLRTEVPHLKRLPSEYIRDHIWVTTQPVEEPERAGDMLSTLEWIGWDRVMFSTDYPHWDQDDPRYAFKVQIPEQQKRMLFRENALSFYNLA